MEHNHNHSHVQFDYNKAFAFGIILNTIYIIVEFVFGLRINSMALIADAGHNLSDVLGLLLAWGASYLARTSTTHRRTYGLRKSTILAAFFNAIILLIAVGAISIEAIRKIIEPQPIGGITMMIVAGIGVVINTLTALLFLKGKENDINIKGAFLHMAADAGVSLGVVAAGLVIIYTNWLWLDPAISLLIVFVITIGTWGLLKDSFMLSMDAVPDKINVPKVKQYLTSLPTVKDIHDLHIWGMSTTETALTAHLVVEKFPADNQLVETINTKLHDEFGIEHPTIQLELKSETNNCEKCG
ncbi:MAG: cation transporter [Ignavibacteria bacterium CG_4_8_14_3_um_filter_37_9]|nr:cation transporter [Ignavibacteria bacterium]PIW99695.1 MAG: cation transporter [Ignavibacteria bacterium CG_4_8_14_3_um_filter_37_9]